MYGIRDIATDTIVLMKATLAEAEDVWQTSYGEGYLVVPLNPRAHQNKVIIEYDFIKSVIVTEDQVDITQKALEDAGHKIDGMWLIDPDKKYHIYDAMGRYISTTTYGDPLMAKAMSDTTEWTLSEAS